MLYIFVVKHFEMTKFTPPISTYNTEELIGIIYSEKGAWVEDAKNQAKQELIKRNVSQKEQEKVVLKWEKETTKHLADLDNQLKKNKDISYSKLRMLYIFAVAPLILVGKLRVGKDLFELKDDNFQIKFKQRLILLITGTIFWTLLLIYHINNL